MQKEANTCFDAYRKTHSRARDYQRGQRAHILGEAPGGERAVNLNIAGGVVLRLVRL